MASLSERASELIHRPYQGNKNVYITDPIAEILTEACQSIEALTESNHASATKIESLTLRIEELEAQLTALAQPKSVGAVVKTAWKPLSESDIPAESE